MLKMSEQIVQKLLENDQVDPKEFALRVGGSLDDDTLRNFKSSATAYIKWVSADVYDPQVAEGAESGSWR